MKKIDTFYLSEKQLEQIKKHQRKPIRLIIAVLLLVISCISGVLLNYAQNTTVEMILTGIVGFGGLGCIILFVSGFDRAGGGFNTGFEKEIEEVRTEEGYFGKEN